MSRRAFILGGTGHIGRAVAGDLLAAGWNVTVSHRGAHAPPEKLVERGARWTEVPGILILDSSQGMMWT